ncbi:MAG: hypothetical protein D3906_10605 [Candidatus Electrothrix sp. AUS1_2]|nr:hypothetical protein [Candidatus Electrothrix sp. AUS1_2]
MILKKNSIFFYKKRKRHIFILCIIIFICLPISLKINDLGISYGEIMILILGCHVYLKNCIAKKIYITKLPLELAVLFLLVMFIIMSSLFNTIDSDGLKMLIRYIEIFLVSFIFYNYFIINNISINLLLKYLFMGLIIASLYSSAGHAISLINIIFDSNFDLSFFEDASLFYGGTFGLLLIIMLQISIYFFIKLKKNKIYRIYLFIMFFFFFTFLLLNSKRTWILFGFIGVMTQLFYYKKILLTVMYIFLFTSMSSLIINDSFFFESNIFNGDNKTTASPSDTSITSSTSLESRWDKWNNALIYFYSHPFVGAGLENPRMGLASWNELLGNKRADNQYIDLLAMTGIFPFILTCYLVYLLAKKTRLLFSYDKQLSLLIGMILLCMFGGALFWQIFYGFLAPFSGMVISILIYIVNTKLDQAKLKDRRSAYPASATTHIVTPHRRAKFSDS